MKNLLTLTLLLTALNLGAADAPKHFRSGEVQFDLYGQAAFKDITDGGSLSGGVGVNYFFTRGFGAGVRVGLQDWQGTFIDTVEPRIYFRAPLWKRIAPYGYVAGLYSFETETFGAGAGGGLEYRLHRNIGLFAEAGLTVDTSGRSSAVGATGIRLAF